MTSPRGAAQGRPSRGLLLRAVTALTMLAALAGAAEAQGRLCRDLKSDLAALGGGSSRQARKYDDAIDRQREQLAIARQQGREARCGIAILSGNLRECAGINATISRMRRNLATLEDQRSTMGGGGGQRQRILAALERNGCTDGDVREAARPPEGLRAAVPDDMPDETARRADRRRAKEEAARLARQQEEARLALAERPSRTEPVLPEKGRIVITRGSETEASIPLETYRTMCVRTCDGYFFPMSPSSTATDLQRDQTNCEAACPGTDIEVFYGPTDGDDPAAMLSTRSGRPYAELPTAYQHQRTGIARAATCGCNARQPFKVIAGTPPAEPPQSEPPAAQAPLPAAAADPGGVDQGVPAQAMPHPVPSPRPGRLAAVHDPATATDAVPPGEQAPLPQQPPAAGDASPIPHAATGSIVTIEAPEPPAKETGPAAAVPAPPAPTEAAGSADQQDRKVRVVGPVFLPDPGEAIDLRAPAQTPAR